MNFLLWLKNNWATIFGLIVSLIGGADVYAGLSGGKSLNDIAMIPGLVATGGGAVWSVLRWLNDRSVGTRMPRQGLDAETQEHIENIFGVAAHQDATEEHIGYLAEMAGTAVRNYASRVRTAKSSRKVVDPKTDGPTLKDLMDAVGRATQNMGGGNGQAG